MFIHSKILFYLMKKSNEAFKVEKPFTAKRENKTNPMNPMNPMRENET
jgi:hypothetical protein